MPDLIRSPDTRAWEGRSVFLGGSIEMGAAELWQPRVADRFLAAGSRASATCVTCRIPAENAESLREVILSLGGEEIVGRKEPD